MIAHPEVLRDLGDAIEGHAAVEIPEDESPRAHPVKDFQLARREVDAARGRLEVEIGHRYRSASNAWLLIDGALSESPQWATDGRMLGIAKSHATLPFGGGDPSTTSGFPPAPAPGVRAGRRPGGPGVLLGPPPLALAGEEPAPWPRAHRGGRHAPTIAHRTQLSRWLLAERCPVSAPDPRWDRLLYGIRAVEQYLRASGE